MIFDPQSPNVSLGIFVHISPIADPDLSSKLHNHPLHDTSGGFFQGFIRQNRKPYAYVYRVYIGLAGRDRLQV